MHTRANKQKSTQNLNITNSIEAGSVARGATAPPPIGMSTKMQNEKSTTFIALLRPLNALEWTK